MYIQESFAEEEVIKQFFKIYKETMYYEQEPEDTVSWKISLCQRNVKQYFYIKQR